MTYPITKLWNPDDTSVRYVPRASAGMYWGCWDQIKKNGTKIRRGEK